MIDCTYDYNGNLNINFVSNGSVSTKEPTKKAYFSEIRGEAIVIGDGETFSLGMSIAEQKLKNPKLSARFASNNTSVTLTTRGNEVLIAHPEDVTAGEYKILKGYAPTYNGSRYYPDGKLIKPEDFKYSVITTCCATWGYTGTVHFSVTNNILSSKSYDVKVYSHENSSGWNNLGSSTFSLDGISDINKWGIFVFGSEEEAKQALTNRRGEVLN